MVDKEVIISRTVKFIIDKYDQIAVNNNLIYVVKPLAKLYLNSSVNGKLDNILSYITNKDGKINVEGLIDDYKEMLNSNKVVNLPFLQGSTIGNGNLTVELPRNFGKLVFKEQDFEDLKTYITNKSNAQI